MIARLKAAFLTPQFARFLLVGGLAAFLQWASRFIFAHWMSYSLAVLAAYAIGLSSAYILNAMFVFERSGRSRAGEIAYFTAVNLAALPVVWGVSMLFGALLLPHLMPRQMAEAIGNAIGILSPVAVYFLLHK
ncbi:MAG: GtrA family protein, partial [Caulobacteraceae bacterium]|nr:GtrA family protein [Caulobacteraceae bacterium]